MEKFHYLFNAPKSQLIKQLSSKYATLPLKDLCIEPINRGEQPEYTDGEINVIKTIDMHNRHIDFENCLKVSQEFYDAHPTAQVKKGDVLIASTGYGSLGKVDIYDRKEPAFVDGHISIVRLKEDYDPYFIMYFLRSTLGQIQFEKWFSGSSGQIEIQPTELGKFLLLSVKSLPLTMQQKIASAISKIYNEIDQLDTKIIVTKKR